MSDAKNTQPQAQKRVESWQDGVSEASPKRALYHTALRTQGYVSNNLTDNSLEFWVALRTDPKADKWRVMHYKLFDLDQNDGKFKSAPVTEKDVGFMEALAHLSRNEYIAKKQVMHTIVDMDTQYPAANFPELRVHYYDVPHYKDPANVEGVAFDEYNDPYRRVEGKIFADATFKRSEVAKSILAVENPTTPNARPVMEAGILSDIFSTSSARAATLDGIIRMGECLSVMDGFAADIATFYMSIQKMLGQKETLDGLDGMTADERKAVTKQAAGSVEGSYDDILRYILPAAAEKLEQAEKLGVHVEPFNKFVAECEVYLHMLNASIRLPKLEASLHSINNSDMDQVIKIQRSMQQAEQAFKRLGGTEEQVDQLKAWVANQSKDNIPGWLPGFLNRYYTSRSKVMANVQARNAKLRDVALMAATVKPPVEDPLPAAAAQQTPAVEQDDAPAEAKAAKKTAAPKPQ